MNDCCRNDNSRFLSGRMSDVMFPQDLASRAVEVIASVKQVFPARVGQVVVGPMLKLGWGRPVSFRERSTRSPGRPFG